jgi:hypothetical protein
MHSLGEKIRTINRRVYCFDKLPHILKSKPLQCIKSVEVKEEELLTLWLSDKLLDTTENDPFAMQELNKAKTILKTYDDRKSSKTIFKMGWRENAIDNSN